MQFELHLSLLISRGICFFLIIFFCSFVNWLFCFLRKKTCATLLLHVLCFGCEYFQNFFFSDFPDRKIMVLLKRVFSIDFMMKNHVFVKKTLSHIIFMSFGRVICALFLDRYEICVLSPGIQNISLVYIA